MPNLRVQTAEVTAVRTESSLRVETVEVTAVRTESSLRVETAEIIVLRPLPRANPRTHTLYVGVFRKNRANLRFSNLELLVAHTPVAKPIIDGVYAAVIHSTPATTIVDGIYVSVIRSIELGGRRRPTVLWCDN